MTDVNANDVVAFFVEIATLVLISAATWRVVPGSLWVRIVAAIAVVGVAMLLWGLFAAPQATFHVTALAIVVKALVLGSGIVAAYALSLPTVVLIAWTVIVVVNTALVYVGPFAR